MSRSWLEERCSKEKERMVVAKISRKDLVPGQHCQMELYNTSDIYKFEFSSSHNRKVKHNKINFNDTF